MSETQSPTKAQSPTGEDHPNIVEEEFEQHQGGQEHQGGHEEDFFGGGEQAEYQNAGNDYGDFGGEQHNQDFGQSDNQGQNQAQGGDGYDDFFGGGGGQPAAQPQGGNFDQQYGQPAYGGAQGMGGYGEAYDPEEEERQEKLRRREQERIQALDEKARTEREKKQEKIANAAKELAQWHSEREQNIQKKKQINKDNQDIQNNAQEEDFKNPWDKIVANIAVKEGEYPGTKDVTRFRQSLQNKKIDASKGLDNDIGF